MGCCGMCLLTLLSRDGWVVKAGVVVDVACWHWAFSDNNWAYSASGTVTSKFAGWVIKIQTPKIEVAVAVEVIVIVKVTVGRFIEVWVEGQLHCRASHKHLTMTALLPLVTGCWEERFRNRDSAGKQANCATEHWLMSGSAANNEQVVFSIKASKRRRALTTITYTKLCTKLLSVGCYPIAVQIIVNTFQLG